MKNTSSSNLLFILSGFIAVLGSLGFARFGYSMILPSMKDGLMLTYTQVGFIESGNFLGYVIFAMVGGLLSSKYGPRIVISASLGLVGLSMILTGFVNSFTHALIFRSLAGIGCGGVNVPAMMLPALVYTAKRRGLAAGVISSGSGVGLVMTGLLVPWLIDIFGGSGWRISWVILGVIALIFTSFCGATLRKLPSITTSGNLLSFKWRNLGSDPLLWKMGITYFMFGISYIIYVTFFGAYLVKELNITSSITGGLWAMVGLLSVASGPIWGNISDRIGREYGLATVYFLQFSSFFLFSLGGIRVIGLSAILFGLTAWGIPSIVAAYSGDHFGSRVAFSALGFLTLFFGIGQVLGPSIAGYLIDYTTSFTSAFLLSSLTAALGGILSLTLLRKNSILTDKMHHLER